MTKKTNSGLKIICLNRKASFNYFFEDLHEAGIILRGSEIKSVRNGKVNIAESYVIERDGELFLVNSHISSYKQASYANHNPIREGFTIIPTKMYFKKGKAKIEIAVAKGKKKFDKRQTIKRRDWDRAKARYFRKS